MCINNLYVMNNQIVQLYPAFLNKSDLVARKLPMQHSFNNRHVKNVTISIRSNRKNYNCCLIFPSGLYIIESVPVSSSRVKMRCYNIGNQ